MYKTYIFFVSRMNSELLYELWYIDTDRLYSSVIDQLYLQHKVNRTTIDFQ